MPHPTQKRSKSRTKRRQYHFKVQAPNLVPCPNCHKSILPHRVCPYCGYYKGTKVISPKEKKAKTAKS
ncbi:50S ribosomal protein L32 [bacterium]|nr:50S ribosomal protein L32 [bacterium]